MSGFLSRINRMFYGYSLSPFMLICMFISIAAIYPAYGFWVHIVFCAAAGAVGALLEGVFR